MKKVIVISLFALLIIAAVVLAYVFRSAPKDVSGVASDLSLGSVELFSEFAADEVNGDSLFIDKIIEVSGTATSVVSDSITLTVTLEGDESGGVICSFNELPKGKLPIVGEDYTIKGKCTGFLMDVNLTKCSLVDREN